MAVVKGSKATALVYMGSDFSTFPAATMAST